MANNENEHRAGEDTTKPADIGADIGNDIKSDIETGVGKTNDVSRYKCVVCDNEFDKISSIEMHSLKSHKNKDAWKGITPKKEEVPPPRGEEILKPPEIEFQDTFLEELKSRLPIVHGIKKVDAIIKTIEDCPTIVNDPTALYLHIKSLVPSANSYSLQWIIRGIYDRLRGPVYQVPTQLMSSPIQQPNQFSSPYQQQQYSYMQTQQMPIQPPRQELGITIDGQEIRTDEKGYLAWKRWQVEERKAKLEEREWELKMEKFKQDMVEKRGEEKEIEWITSDGKKIKIKESALPYLIMSERNAEDPELKRELGELKAKFDDEREKRHELEIKRIEERIVSPVDALRSSKAFLEEMGIRVGGSESAKDSYALVDKGIDAVRGEISGARSDFKEVMSQRGFEPEFKRTAEQRAEKAEEILQKTETAERIRQLEDSILSG